MALPTRDDITYDKGNLYYGTMKSQSAEAAAPGSAGDPAAEAASAGIVNTDASAELARQVPNIVVPVNQSSDSDNIINTVDEGLMEVPGEGITSQVDVTNKLNLNPKNLLTKQNAIGLALGIINPIAALAYRYYNNQQAKKAIERQTAVDEAETARLDDTPENEGFTSVADQEFAETGDYDVYSDTPTGPVGAQFGDPTYADPGVDAEENQPTYTAPAPTVDYGYDANYGYQDSGSDSDDSSSGGTTGEGYGGGYGSDYGFAVGGIVRLRKNKQNSRIHDRRKRLAMGGITSLHG